MIQRFCYILHSLPTSDQWCLLSRSAMDSSTTFNILGLLVSRPPTSRVLLRFWVLGCVKHQPSLGKLSSETVYSSKHSYFLQWTWVVRARVWKSHHKLPLRLESRVSSYSLRKGQRGKSGAGYFTGGCLAKLASPATRSSRGA